MAFRRKYTKKKYKKAKGGALRVPRGGFVMPPALTKVRATVPVVTRVGKDLGRALKAPTWENAEALMDSTSQLVDIYSDKAGVKTTVNPKGSPGFPKGKDALPNITKDSVQRMSGSNMVQTARKFRTNIKTGAASSASVKRCAKNYGTTSTVLYDSERDANTAKRNVMTVNFGFNQKAFWLPTSPDTYFTAREYSTFWEAESTAVPDTGTQQLYGLALNQRNVFKISNSNTYFPVKVKAHLVASMDPSVDPTEMRGEVWNQSEGIQKDSAIPEIYQFATGFGDNTQYVVECDTKANLKQSSFFRNKQVILRTVSKRLAPGDVWELTNDHAFGSGLDLYLTRQTSKNGSLNPVGAYWVFELEGIQCEGVDKVSGATYIGTSPGAISWENKKVWSYVNSPSPSINGDGVVTQKAFKIYENNILSGEKRYNVGYANIGAPSDAIQMYIPVVSDANRTYAQSAVDQDITEPEEKVVNNYYVMNDSETLVDADFTNENEI